MVFDTVVALASNHSYRRRIGDHRSPSVAVHHRGRGCVPRRPTPQPGLGHPLELLGAHDDHHPEVSLTSGDLEVGIDMVELAVVPASGR